MMITKLYPWPTTLVIDWIHFHDDTKFVTDWRHIYDGKTNFITVGDSPRGPL
jgi:hypothetical protein